MRGNSPAKTNGRGRRTNCRRYVRILTREKRILQKQYQVKEVGIFGSYVRGEQKKKSDLDILVEFSETPGLLKFIRLENYLTKVLHHKVDLVHKKALRRELKGSILREVVYV